MGTLSDRSAWERGLEREWLVADGLGGYASGTVVGPHTRRYHGWLVAPLAPPLGRHVLLSKAEERLTVDGQSFDLGANEFADGTVAPHGYELLRDFALEEGDPVWRFAAGGAALERRIRMEPGHTTSLISYSLSGSEPAHLTLTALCNFRDYHRETIGSEDWRFLADRTERGVTVRAYGGATPYYLFLLPAGGRDWSFGGYAGWWWHLLHRAERDRGLDHQEDVFAVGAFETDLQPGETVTLVATIEAPEVVLARLGSGTSASASLSAPASRTTPAPRSRARRQPPAPVAALAQSGPAASAAVAAWATRAQGRSVARATDAAPLPADAADPFLSQLRRAAHQFLVPRAVPGEPDRANPDGTPQARTVLAGYHWFGDWGRDTMIALPGLAQATGRYAEAHAILEAFSHYVDRGMLPNRFPDSGAPLNDGDYNTVDATLWYFHAVDVIDQASGGRLAAQLYPVLAEIVEHHVRGTRFGIGVDPQDGLVRVGDPQLTWMDAKVGDWVCTPRAGKPVEIEALWIHALALMVRWAGAERKRDDWARFEALRASAAAGFAARFWNAATGCLFDLVDGVAGDDGSLRPNQAIAAMLPDCPLEPAQRKAVVDVVAERLWTPRGLRTLAQTDSRYRGTYRGDPWSRDTAYHQGTVWPWLLGPFVDAHLLVYRDKAAARRFVEPMREHLLDEACAGSVSEIFDGDAPHRPNGCIAQAWSVAELYRAWVATATEG